MTKQILEIEVPEGKKAVWKNNHIYFEDVDMVENIKTVKDAVRFLVDKGICENIRNSLLRLPENSFEWKIAAYRAVVAAVTYNEERYLISGERWYPTIEFCKPGKLKNCYGKTIVGRIESEEGQFDVVGGGVDIGAYTGIGAFNLEKGVADAWIEASFRSVGSEKSALYISKQFGRLLFEISYGGVNCNWKWID